MKMQWIGALLLAIASVAVAAQDVQVAHRQGSVSVDALAIGAAKSISYNDDKGRPISKRIFLDAVTHGRQFTYKRDEAHESTAFTLFAPGAKVVRESPLQQDYKIKAGQAFPAFRLATVGGGSVDDASLRGRPTVLHFFFAGCVLCFGDNPALNAYAQKHPEVRVLAVTHDDAQAATTYVQQRQLAWPVAYAGQGLFDTLGVTAFPTMALVGADGSLLDIRLVGSMQAAGGSLSERDLDRWVRQTLLRQVSQTGDSAQPQHQPRQ